MPTAFESHKRKLYTLRILRELEPSILIALSLFSYTSSLWAARSGASYSSAMMNPWRSQALDKAAWHFAITSGETDPVTGNAYWQEVDVLDVYTNQQVADIESGALKQWPKTKNEAWNDASNDDLWCIVYPAASKSHMSYGPIRLPNGTCGSLPPHVNEWCSGWKTSVHVANLATFPTDDPGWRCLTPNSWPATPDGHCYSMCLDVSGESFHSPPHQTMDILMLLFLPVIFDLYFILTWINGKSIFAGIHGTISCVQKVRACVRACVLCYTAAHPA